MHIHQGLAHKCVHSLGASPKPMSVTPAATMTMTPLSAPLSRRSSGTAASLCGSLDERSGRGCAAKLVAGQLQQAQGAGHATRGLLSYCSTAAPRACRKLATWWDRSRACRQKGRQHAAQRRGGRHGRLTGATHESNSMQRACQAIRRDLKFRAVKAPATIRTSSEQSCGQGRGGAAAAVCVGVTTT